MSEQVVVLPGTSADDGEAWLPVVAAGGSVVLDAAATGPGTEAVREAVAFGLARVVDLADDGAVAAAVTQLEAAEVEEADRRRVVALVRARRAGTDVATRTRPRVLVVALVPEDVDLVRRAQACGAGLGMELRVWASREVVRSGLLPATATVVDLGSAGGAVLPDRAERVLAVQVPRVVRGVLRRLPAGPLPAGATGRPHARWEQRAARGTGAVLHGWRGLELRLRPALAARAVGGARVRTLDVDLVLASAVGQAVVWRLLRARPALEARGSLNVAAVHDVVRRRSRAFADTLLPATAEEPAPGDAASGDPASGPPSPV